MLEFLRTNLAWMIVALAMSSTLWATVANQQNPDSPAFVSGIPVELRDIPSGLVASSAAPSVKVDVRAPADLASRLVAGMFRAHIDLSHASAGVQEYPVSVDTTDRRVSVERVTPEKVTLRLEPITKKDVPVRLNVLDNAPFGYIAKTAKVTPSQITVTGPQGEVDQVVAATVEVRLDNARASISQPERPIPQNSAGEEIKDVTTVPESVLVEVPIEQQLTYKALPIAPQVAGSVALGYQIVGIMVDPTVVTVVGDPGTLDQVPFLSTKPIDISGATADVVTNGDVALPNGVSLVRQQPITVRVYISPVEASKIVQVVPQVKGLSDHQHADVTPNALDITVSGPMPILSTLRPQDVQATVDATGVGSGTKPITVTASVPSPLRVDGISPQQVTVTVR